MRIPSGHPQDEERRRLARELHDSAGQLLAALSMNLAPLESVNGQMPQWAGKAISESLGLVNELSKQLRTISHLLHPPLLDEVGLRSALQFYLEGFMERAKSRSTSNPQTISVDSRRKWKPPFFGLCRSA